MCILGGFNTTFLHFKCSAAKQESNCDYNKTLLQQSPVAPGDLL